MKEVMSCLNCGKLVKYKSYNDHLLCDDCVREVHNRPTMLDCVVCGAIDITNNMTLLTAIGSYVCKDCEELECFTCDRCEELDFYDHSVTTPEDETLCIDCWENDEVYLFCECGEMVRYDEVDDNYLCEECQRYHGLI